MSGRSWRRPDYDGDRGMVDVFAPPPRPPDDSDPCPECGIDRGGDFCPVCDKPTSEDEREMRRLRLEGP